MRTFPKMKMHLKNVPLPLVLKHKRAVVTNRRFETQRLSIFTGNVSGIFIDMRQDYDHSKDSQYPEDWAPTKPQCQVTTDHWCDKWCNRHNQGYKDMVLAKSSRSNMSRTTAWMITAPRCKTLCSLKRKVSASMPWVVTLRFPPGSNRRRTRNPMAAARHTRYQLLGHAAADPTQNLRYKLLALSRCPPLHQDLWQWSALRTSISIASGVSAPIAPVKNMAL